MKLTPLFSMMFFSLISIGHAACPPETQEVNLQDLIPTQTEISFQTVEQLSSNFDSKVTDEKSLSDLYHERTHTRPIPVIEGPCLDGSEKCFYILDNHHILVPWWRAVQNGKISIENAKVCVKNTDSQIYGRVSSFEEFATTLSANRVGYLGRLLKNRVENGTLTPEAAYREVCSRKLHELQDNPLRGLVAGVFSDAGLRGGHFVNYVEFLVAEKLEKNGSSLNSRIEEAVWLNPEIVDFLKANFRNSEMESEAVSLITKQVSIYAESWRRSHSPSS